MSHELVSWWLFLASATFFVAVAVRERDLLSLFAAGLFFAACVVFLAGNDQKATDNRNDNHAGLDDS